MTFHVPYLGNTRPCIDCKKVKAKSEFSMRRYRTSPDGPLKISSNSVCKPCMVIRTNTYVKNNKEKYLKYHRMYWRKKQNEKKAKEKAIKKLKKIVS